MNKSIEDYQLLVDSLKDKISNLNSINQKQRKQIATWHKEKEEENLIKNNVVNVSKPMDKKALDDRINNLKNQNESLKALLKVSRNELEKFDLIKYSFVHGDFKTLSGEVKTFSGFIKKETTSTLIILIYSMKHQLFYNYCIKKELIGSFKIYNINETKKTLDYHKLMDFIKAEKKIEEKYTLAWKDN